MKALLLIAVALACGPVVAKGSHTVKGHVSNILSKLHLADRTQAAVFAWREGMIRREG